MFIGQNPYSSLGERLTNVHNPFMKFERNAVINDLLKVSKKDGQTDGFLNNATGL